MRVRADVLRALRAAAEQEEVDLALLAAIAWKESGFNPLAVGDLYAGVSLGLGQINLEGAGAAYRENPHKLLDPYENARVMARYVKDCQQAFPTDLLRGISAYNQGIGGAQQPTWWEVNGETYVEPVMANLAQIQREGLEEVPAVPDKWAQYGYVWEDVAENLKGIADFANYKAILIKRIAAAQTPEQLRAAHQIPLGG